MQVVEQCRYDAERDERDPDKNPVQSRLYRNRQVECRAVLGDAATGFTEGNNLS